MVYFFEQNERKMIFCLPIYKKKKPQSQDQNLPAKTFTVEIKLSIYLPKTMVQWFQWENEYARLVVLDKYQIRLGEKIQNEVEKICRRAFFVGVFVDVYTWMQ